MAANDTHAALFETLLVFDGQAVELERHLERLTGSVQELYGAEPPAVLARNAAEAATGQELARMRIDVAAGEDGALAHTIVVTPLDPAIFFPPRSRGAALRSVLAPGGSGQHKFAERGLIERFERELGDEVPLMVDSDGDVLEAGRANVFAVLGGRLATPPTDGRILAGTTRALVLELAAELGIEATERTLSVADLHAADEVFLTSSLRGIRPARLLDGEELGISEAVSGALAAALRERWLGAGALS